MASNLDQSIQYLKGVGEKRAGLYQKLGVLTLDALLRYYPRTYLDFSHPVSISAAPVNTVCPVLATVFRKTPEQRIRKGMTLYKVYVTDHGGDMILTFFNNKYTPAALREGQEYLFYGKVTGTFTRKEMGSPQVFSASERLPFSPVYALTEGLSSRMISANVQTALNLCQSELSDPLPLSLRRECQLCENEYAIRNIHFPEDEKSLSLARTRLIFEELLVLKCALSFVKNRNLRSTGHAFSPCGLEEFYRALPFTLTGAQKRAAHDCLRDMSRHIPMNRLVQGDVGSGKTMVAAAAVYNACTNGAQAALMAPTELLAHQHFEGLAPLLAPLGIKTVLLTGSLAKKQKAEVLEQLRAGEAGFVIGTHALISESVSFDNLGLVVTDEQHRFGVSQRGILEAKGKSPHVLVMSATPIPRTLALIIYGDLDISIIDELPPGRQPVSTYLIDTPKRKRMYGFIRQHLDKGKQAYIVCPVIEEGETDMVSAEEYAEKISREDFKGYSVGLLHGKMKSARKDAVMQSFKSGEIQLLVSTTVVEVGVDVPNAVVMVIENADRFGLSQLHQLRGRVGRGRDASFCILVSDAKSEDTLARLKALCKTTDGFAIAEEDLKLRGPGDFFGTKQHGLPQLKIADMLTDVKLLKLSGEASDKLLADDPDLSKTEHTGLRTLVMKMVDNELCPLN